MGTGLDRDGLVDDIALNTRSCSQPHLDAAYPADDTAVDDDVVCG